MTDAEQIAEARALLERLTQPTHFGMNNDAARMEGFVSLEHTRAAATALTTLLDAQEAAQATIAELQADADEAFATATEAGRVMGEAVDGMKAAEAKLAKAVEALERIAGVKGPYSHPFPESYEGYGAFAIVTSRETLAEIKGESHE